MFKKYTNFHKKNKKSIQATPITQQVNRFGHDHLHDSVIQAFQTYRNDYKL